MPNDGTFMKTFKTHCIISLILNVNETPINVNETPNFDANNLSHSKKDDQWKMAFNL